MKSAFTVVSFNDIAELLFGRATQGSQVSSPLGRAYILYMSNVAVWVPLLDRQVHKVEPAASRG